MVRKLIDCDSYDFFKARLLHSILDLIHSIIYAEWARKSGIAAV